MKLKDFIDKDENEFALYDEVWGHIRKYHPEIKDLKAIETIIKNPDVIVRSSWDKNSNLYYKTIGHLFRVVVVQTEEKRVKTTLTTDKVKKGEILWKKR